MEDSHLFKDISKEVYLNYLKIKKYQKGQLIFNEGEECLSLGILLKGEIRISTLTLDDKDYTINILKKGDIFGETLLFSTDQSYLGDGLCYKDCEVGFIKKNDLLKLLKNEKFLVNYLEVLALKNAKNNYRIKLLSQKSISDRILFFLNIEAKRHNSLKITISSKEKLAKILNIPRPSLSRELINLKEKGLINYDKTSITLNYGNLD